MQPIETFVAGMITAGFFIAGLFFARFWSRTRDPLFASFAGAFWLLAINKSLLMLTGISHEERTWTYVLRAVAFTLIAAAIVRKNAGRRPERR
ncbi:MAG TPA: DUF5985 family protein [Acetobacteraceae bacterium]|nr:DUF5985 family protein [Acetobacteraceae bacterium]